MIGVGVTKEEGLFMEGLRFGDEKGRWDMQLEEHDGIRGK